MPTLRQPWRPKCPKAQHPPSLAVTKHRRLPNRGRQIPFAEPRTLLVLSKSSVLAHARSCRVNHEGQRDNEANDKQAKQDPTHKTGSLSREERRFISCCAPSGPRILKHSHRRTRINIAEFTSSRSPVDSPMPQAAHHKNWEQKSKG